MKLQSRIALIGLTGILVAGFVYSQIYIHHKNRSELKDIASELAETWKNKLNLSDRQTSLLEDTIIEFTLRKNEILNGVLNNDAIIRRLKAIQKAEHKSLKKFLENDQFENYIQINKQITRKV